MLFKHLLEKLFIFSAKETVNEIDRIYDLSRGKNYDILSFSNKGLKGSFKSRKQSILKPRNKFMLTH